MKCSRNPEIIDVSRRLSIGTGGAVTPSSAGVVGIDGFETPSTWVTVGVDGVVTVGYIRS